jgi:hypothetical protein
MLHLQRHVNKTVTEEVYQNTTTATYRNKLQISTASAAQD